MLDQCIEIRYIYSACVVTSTPDVKILHDPWFTEGIYDGSWYHFPKVNNPIETIGEVDLIYISHIHPDHYDHKFLKQYFSIYGEKEIIIADHAINHLANKMKVDSLKYSVLKEPRRIRNTTIELTPHKTGNISDIDSAASIRYFDGKKEHVILNTNDIVVDDQFIDTIKNVNKNVDILLCGYTGAGPYPQTYFNQDSPNLQKEASKKRKISLSATLGSPIQFRQKVNIPFAGKYILGGNLSNLNYTRGVSDAVEVKNIDSRAVVLADGGNARINTSQLTPSETREQAYSLSEMNARIAEIKNTPMSYEKLFSPKNEIHQLPLKRLLRNAARNANTRAQLNEDYFFIIHLPENEIAIINANKKVENSISFCKNIGQELPSPRSEIHIDPRYLFGLLTHIYHWNNAEVGSQYNTRRHPNEFNRCAQSFLDYLSI